MIMIRKIIKKYREIFFKKYYGNLNYRNNSKDLDLDLKRIYKNFFVYKIKNCRIYTNTHNVAYISKKNVVLNGPSIQIESHKNANIKKNITFRTGTPKFCKYYDGTAISLLAGPRGDGNFWHWIFDTLPRIHLIKKIYNIKKKDYLLLQSLKYKFQYETIKHLNIRNILVLNDLKHVYFKKVYCTSAEIIDYSNQKIEYPKWIINYLRKTFLKEGFNRTYLKRKNIYISRDDSHIKNLRYLVNENSLKKILKKKNFKIVKMTDYSFERQAKLFNKANCIVGVSGAAFSNIIFCRKNCKIIEFVPNTNSGKIVSNLAKRLFLKKYNLIKCKTLNNGIYRRQDGILLLNLKKFEKILNN